VRAGVELAEIGGDAAGDGRELGRGHGAIQEAGGDGLFRAINLGVDDCPVEVRRGKPVAAQLDAEGGHRDADRHLVRADLIRARGPHAVVAREHEERTHRQRMAGAGDDDRPREREQARPELEASADHFVSLRAAGLQRPQIEPGGEDPLPARQDHGGLLGRRAVERTPELGEHPERQRVHLPVVHRDRRDGLPKLVRDDGVHSPSSLAGSRVRGLALGRGSRDARLTTFTRFVSALRNNDTIRRRGCQGLGSRSPARVRLEQLFGQLRHHLQDDPRSLLRRRRGPEPSMTPMRSSSGTMARAPASSFHRIRYSFTNAVFPVRPSEHLALLARRLRACRAGVVHAPSIDMSEHEVAWHDKESGCCPWAAPGRARARPRSRPRPRVPELVVLDLGLVRRAPRVFEVPLEGRDDA
jgi:hypothetical protein